MEEYELLVHVSAAARVQDDRQYLSVAQSIIDFEAATVTAITTCQKSPLTGTQDGDSGRIETYSRPESINGSFMKDRSQEGGEAPRSVTAASPAGWARIKPGLKLPPTKKRPSINPPYRNPLHRAPTRAISSNPQTPDQRPRPKTAPDLIERSVQVPFTGVALRRTNSEWASFGSLSSWISDSQKTSREPSSASQPEPRSVVNAAFVEDSMMVSRSLTWSLSQTSLEGGPQPKRPRLSGHGEFSAAPVVQDRPVRIESYFLRDRSLDWTSSPTGSGETRTDSVPSTASLSQPLPASAGTNKTDHLFPSQPPAAVHLDLTFSSSSRGATGAEHAQRSPPDAYDAVNSQPPSSSLHESVEQSLLFGADVPFEVTSEEPRAGQTKFTSHITRPLEDFASRLPFEKYFRPVEVKRDVQVLERGYWLLEVMIADAEVVETARRSPTKEEKLQALRDRLAGATSEERWKKYEDAKRAGDLHSYQDKAVGLWTREEFLRFWKDVSTYIEDGKAGWGIRMVREETDLDSSEAGIARIRIRIFCWGEILGHLYLALWVLSDKGTSRIPMQWIAGDGTVVVKMAGIRVRQGKLGRWTRKGPEAEGGRWGVS